MDIAPFVFKRHFCRKFSMVIGLIREGKIPPDNRVALTPAQCRWIARNFPGITIQVQRSQNRCFSDSEFSRAGMELVDDLQDCSIILGIKEIPPAQLLPGKTYLFFSHTRKRQPYNQGLMQALVREKCTLIDYECMEHEDGQRIIGFGFFAGVVGAHNGMMAFGARSKTFFLDRVYKQKDFKELIHCYFGLKIPTIKIAVTGSGRVAHGILEVMNLMGIIEVEKDEYLSREFAYPVYVQLKGADLYMDKITGGYNREDFHRHPEKYVCRFEDFIPHTDILMNGIYWDVHVPRLFPREAVSKPDFRIQVIADVTDDANGSIPINLGDQVIENPIYGVDRQHFHKTEPGLPGSVDVMAVGNLPNELPRDASKYFGEQLIKYILPDLLGEGSAILERATILKEGNLTERYGYLKDYAEGKS
jgi:alanine dehydrogenase